MSVRHLTKVQQLAARLLEEADTLDMGRPPVSTDTKRQAAENLLRMEAENQVMRHLCERACIALQEDEFPSLREQLRIATKEEDHHV